MTKVDLNYPLPIINLHTRYDPVFDGLKKGLNITLVGLPQSSRSSFLKFILTFNTSLLNDFIDHKKFQFIHLEVQTPPENKYIASIVFEIFGRELLPTDDPLLMLSAIKQNFSKKLINKRVIFVIYEVDEFRIKNPETFRFIQDLLSLNKHNIKKAGFQAVFISSPKNIDTFISDKVVYFDLFNKDELDYTRKRLEFFRSQQISDKVHNLASLLSFGHYLLYKFLSDLPLNDLQKIKFIKQHESINNLLNIIWLGTGSVNLISRFKPYKKPILLPPISKSLKENGFGDIIQLTAQERILFDLLKNKADLTTRDEIAQTIWGGEWTEKYSDWAIDKLISKLKSKLIYSSHEIITLRNRGYQLKTHVI